MTENKVIGRKFRVVVDAANNVYSRLSFWTHSKDVEFQDTMTAEQKVGAIKGLASDISVVTTSGFAADAVAVKNAINDGLEEIKESFQDGVDSIYNALASLGATPDSKDLGDVVSAIAVSGLKRVIYLGEGTSFTVTSAMYDKYDELTADNFIVEPISDESAQNKKYADVFWKAKGVLTKSYDASTGVLTAYNRAGFINAQSKSWAMSVRQPVKAYLIIG